ncbi:MAG: NAD(P)H-dependent oxidoreductase [Candidatus Doudnabacteria bacterium]|nr:NAD(P)H-dependent oxidoreductase [Candidatus Doudnabacteria bacterium]
MRKGIRILGINGSPFKKGTTAKVLKTALLAARETGASSVRTFHLRGDIPHCDGRREEHLSLRQRIARVPTRGNLRAVIKAIIQADGVIFATPTHSFSMSSRIKAVIDWLMVTVDAPEYALKGKIAGLMAVCESDGASSAGQHMQYPLDHLGFAFPAYTSHYYYNKSSAATDEGDWQRRGQAIVGRNVVRQIQINRGQKKPGDWEDDTNRW